MTSADNSTNMSGKKKKYYDGMEAVVEIAGKKSLCISNCYPTLRNFIHYDQIGIYYGETTGIEATDVVRVYFRKPKNWKEQLRELTSSITLNYGNIERVEFVRAGVRPKGVIAGFKLWAGIKN